MGGLPETVRELFREWGRKGGKAGKGKHTLSPARAKELARIRWTKSKVSKNDGNKASKRPVARNGD